MRERKLRSGVNWQGVLKRRKTRATCIGEFSTFCDALCLLVLLLELKSVTAQKSCGCTDLCVLCRVYHDGMLSYVIEIYNLKIQMLPRKNAVF